MHPESSANIDPEGILQRLNSLTKDYIERCNFEELESLEYKVDRLLTLYIAEGNTQKVIDLKKIK